MRRIVPISLAVLVAVLAVLVLYEYLTRPKEPDISGMTLPTPSSSTAPPSPTASP